MISQGAEEQAGFYKDSSRLSVGSVQVRGELMANAGARVALVGEGARLVVVRVDDPFLSGLSVAVRSSYARILAPGSR